MDEKTHINFMGIMAEMTVMYYDHTFCAHMLSKRGSQGSFEVFCGNIVRYLGNAPNSHIVSSEGESGTLIVWLMTELEVEYGLNEGMAAEIVVGFFTERFYRDIYNGQSMVNDYLFPNGYYNRRNQVNL